MQQIRTLKLLVVILMTVIYGVSNTAAQTATDLLKTDMVDFNGTNSYKDADGIMLTSNAVYSVSIAKSATKAIMIRKDENSGIVTTETGGRVKRIIIYWNPQDITSTEKALKIYGKDSPYTSTADLSNAPDKEIIHTIERGTPNVYTIGFDDEYKYIGIKAVGGTANLDSIAIVWASEAYTNIKTPMFTPAAGTYNTTQNVTITAESGNTIYYTTDGSEPTGGTGLIYNDGTPIIVDRDMTVKAMAVDEQSDEQSDVAIAKYIIKRIFSFSADEAKATLGKEFIAPELKNTYPDGTVIWNSSDNSVASVDNNGDVTPLSQGTTVITAQLSRPDHPTLTATYRLIVSDPSILPLGNAYYKRVTSNADIVDGGVYLIVCKTNETNGANGMAMGEIVNKCGIGVDVNIGQERIDIPTDAEIIITKHTNNTWILRNKTGYLGYKNDTDFEISSSSNTAKAFQWVIDATTPDNVTIKSNNAVNRYIKSKITDKKFRVYSQLNGTSNISLYRKMGALKITGGGRDADGRYYATYFTDVAIAVPEDITFTTVGINKDGQMTLTDFSANSVIPASTGLVVSAAEPGVYEYAASGKKSTNPTGNHLKGDVKDITADDMTAANPECTFFRLAKPAGESLGFWWGAPDGNGFSLGACKAYLAVPNSISAAKGFSFGSAVSSLKAIHAHETPRSGIIYNLHGQRVSDTARPGIYIKDGKKLIKRQ